MRLPTGWINEKRLSELHWEAGGKGSDNSAALLCLAAIAHHASMTDGTARVTYGPLCKATGLSRSKLSDGLDVLEKMKLIERGVRGRSTYALNKFQPRAEQG